MTLAHVSWGRSELVADPAQLLTTAGEEPDDLDHDVYHLSATGVKLLT